MARKLRQVTDLYVTGTPVKLLDGTTLWMQALNPFEQDSARNEATIAKARVTLAINTYGSDEHVKVRHFFFEEGIESAREKIVDVKVAESLPKLVERISNDPDWKEKLAILERGLEDTATPAEPGEVALVNDLSTQYTEEIGKRVASERDFLIDVYSDATEDTLWDEYLEWYISRRATEIALAEYRLHQVLFGARWCEGTVSEDGAWEHGECDGHQDRVFVTKEQVRQAPEDLIDLLMNAAADIEMTVREAKNSRRQGSSFDSSPLPSEAAESTASIPEEIPVAPLGTSSMPSATPSPSSASVS